MSLAQLLSALTSCLHTPHFEKNMDLISSKRFTIGLGEYLIGCPGSNAGVFIAEPGVLVKYGERVRSIEAETMEFIRKACPEIPVPEVLSYWQEDGLGGCLAMTRMPGKSLHLEWAKMGPCERDSVISEYHAIASRLRALRPTAEVRIGALGGGSVIDHRCSGTAVGGVCSTESDFNNFLLSQLHPLTKDVQRETIKCCLRSNHEIRFTHGDFGPHNILVDSESGHITGVIDWEHAGWYPEYWEYIKMGLYGTADNDLLWHARQFWGEGVFYDQELVTDSMLDAFVWHGQRVLKRVR